MALFQPPPTIIQPNGETLQWDAVWIKYWAELIATLNTSIGGGGSSATTAIEVFGKRERPGAGIFQPDAQTIQAMRSFLPPPSANPQSTGDSQSILATQIFGA